MYELTHSKLTGALVGVVRLADNTAIPKDERSMDWQAFLEWNAAQPVPLDLSDLPPPVPPTPEEILAALRQQAKDIIESLTDAAAKVDRAIVLAATDSDNVLRAQVIGTTTITYDPPSLANNAESGTPNVPLAGAEFGDLVFAQPTAYSTEGILVYGYVVSSGVVAARLRNGTGVTRNLASGQWRVYVLRPAALPEISPQNAKAAVTNRIDAGTDVD